MNGLSKKRNQFRFIKEPIGPNPVVAE